MTQLPSPREPVAVDLVLPTGTPQAPPDDELRLEQIWAVFWRHRWLLLGCIAIACGLAHWKTRQTTPLYEASATVQISEKAPNIEGFFRPLSAGELSTEAEVLRSRTLAEDAVAALQLQLRVHAPRGAIRDELFDSISVAPDATPGSYGLRAGSNGRFAVIDLATQREVAGVAPGEHLRIDGTSLRLSERAAEHDRIVFSVTSAVRAAEGVSSTLRISMAHPDAEILKVRFEDTDRELTWRVPNVIVDRFIVRRNRHQKQEARSTVAFLRGQLDTIVAQLSKAEGAVKDYREQNLVVAPEAEATSQVTRLVSLQAERTTVEGERDALAKLLEDVDAQAAARRPGEPSPYRQLLAFPTLLRSQAAADLLSTLSAVEQERTTLLVRRTPQDPDVKALDDRVSQLEGQLRSVVAAYLQGLTNQIATLDVGLKQFGAQLGRLPQKEFEVARLERQPKVLEEIYTLLQTRLKEAEIAQAVEDPSVSLVDPAIPPRHPFKPRPLLNLTAGVLGGLVVGVVLAILLELRDKAVRSRADVRLATGLPLLGLIPHLPRSRGRVPLFVERRALAKARGPAKPKPRLDPAQYVPPVRPKPAYTFFQDGGPEPEPVLRIERPVEPPTEGPTPQLLPVLHLTVSDSGRHVAEAYGILQTNILFARQDDNSKVLVLTSPLPGDGKTTTAVNLAVALARGGLAVLLIDADLRRGMVHSAFNIDRAPGFSDVLQGALPFARARVSIDVEGHELHVLASGSSVPNSSALLTSGELRTLLEQAREQYDAVIFDTPPTNVVTDASLLAAQADSVVLVARAGMTESGALGLAAEQLRHVRAPLLGVIMNDLNFKRDASYDGAYRYYDYSQYTGSQG